MQKLKYAFFHGLTFILIGIVAITFISVSIHDTVAQINSAKNGIEVLMVDTVLSSGGTPEFVSHIKEKTGVDNVGVATLVSSDAKDYIKTIENYTMTDYLNYLCASKNCELIVVSKSLLSDVYKMNNIAPLCLEGDFEDACYSDGVLYALNLKYYYFTEYDATIISLQEDAYGILLNGDHTAEMRTYINKLYLGE